MHSFLKGHIFARRVAPLTIPELVAVSGIPDVCFGAFTKDEDIELLVLRPDGNISVHLIPTSRLPRALSWDAACAADESTFDDPRLPDDIFRTKQLLGLTLYAERSHGSSAFAALARGLTAMLGGFYEIEGAYFTPEGETLGVPKRAARSRPEPPSPARVAKRALVLCALAER